MNIRERERDQMKIEKINNKYTLIKNFKIHAYITT